jgi:hypothetical protein
MESDFQRILDTVPDYQVFLTVDELDASARALAEEYPDTVTLFEAGRSRKGHPILCLKIGDGPRNALCYGCPHPNEPIGAMTMEAFARILAEDKALRDRLGFTWYIIKCVDPDGVRLNEAWYKGPFSLTNYIRNFYRPAFNEQVEWTFPVEYKTYRFDRPLPETRALMNIVDQHKPAFIYSLHNAGFGGAFWYISHDIPELYEPFRNAARRQNVPLFYGEPEAPFIQTLAPNVYKFFGVEEHYDYLERTTGQAPVLNYGTSCGTYARTKAECLTLLTELPYFTHPSIQDQSETDMTSREALLKGADLADAHYAQVDEYLSGFRRYISGDNPFVRLVDEMIGMAKESGPAMRQFVSSNPELDRPAPASLVFDCLTVRKFYMGLLHGMAVRACRFELERRADDGEAYTVLKNALDAGEARLNALCEALEQELDYAVVPIRNLVSIQLESGLLVADYMAKNWKP